MVSFAGRRSGRSFAQLNRFRRTLLIGAAASRLCALGCMLSLFCGAEAHASPLRLEEARAYSERKGGISLLILQHDETLLEAYSPNHRATDASKIYSGTKSFWGIAAMVAVSEGILSLDEPASETLGEWRNDPKKKQITIRELLNFTDGIAPGFILHGDSISDRNTYAISLPVVARERSAFIYGPSHLQILCEVLRRKLERRRGTPYGYLQSRVLDPLDLGDVRHIEDREGNPLMATGFMLTARQWARLGDLILHGGLYHGARVVDRALLEGCFRGTEANPAFGMAFWVNREAGKQGARELDVEKTLEPDWRREDWRRACICRDAPADMIVSLGSGYQRLYVIPSLDLIVVRQGVNAAFSDGDFLRILLGRSR